MPSFAPLRPGDPPSLAGLDLLGRLGEGGQGVVYLAKDHSGTHVAVKWLRPDLSGDEVSVERFLREVQVAQQVAPFCTATVLGTGVEQDRPFIVSEFIEGPSLQRVVQEEGPRTGSTLHRLAIGTATALAAIHQAGIVHRDFKPANVILGADGPRVIDFGIARALNATSTISSMVVGTPSYMPPEQIMGHTVGPAADMFSWASAMVYAASGRAPFGSDTMPAVINRVLNQQPDLGVLDGALRDVVAACLAKDPAQRPTAEQVIMRLLQHPMPANSAILAAAAAEAVPARPPSPGPMTGPPGPPPPGPMTGPPGPMTGPVPGAAPNPMTGPVPGPPPYPPRQQQWHPPSPYAQPTHPGVHHQPPGRKSRAPLIIGVTLGVALLVLAGLVVLISAERTPLAGDGGTTTPPATQPADRSTPPTTPPATPPVTEVSVPKEGPRKALPGAAISLYENPADAIVLTSYEILDKKKSDWVDHARDSLRGPFRKYAGNWESSVSPGGQYLATRGRKYSDDNYDYIIVSDRRSGERSTIKTVRSPLIASIRGWSQDASKILLNIERKSGDTWTYPGFVIVDVATMKARIVTVDDAAVRKTAFGWDGKDEGVVNIFGSEKNRGLRFFDAQGKATRDVRSIGTLPAGTQDIFSPSGESFLSDCPNGSDGDTCVWDVKSGDRTHKFSSDCDKVLGWYDDTHLYCWEQDNNTKDEIQVVDFKGTLLRKIVDVPDDVDFSPVFTVNPDKGS
ncbi:serine/threonine protein kinase [Nonomuraea spiralis]|uniref:serine/threonine protein kinase n=1 Tax=Nonomuraea spiralis TaxID=46182 RepID=UPI0037A48A8F